MKWSETYDSGTRITHICGPFDFVMFQIILGHLVHLSHHRTKLSNFLGLQWHKWGYLSSCSLLVSFSAFVSKLELI